MLANREKIILILVCTTWDQKKTLNTIHQNVYIKMRTGYTLKENYGKNKKVWFDFAQSLESKFIREKCFLNQRIYYVIFLLEAKKIHCLILPRFFYFKFSITFRRNNSFFLYKIRTFHDVTLI